jgi:hypothetical protein
LPDCPEKPKRVELFPSDRGKAIAIMVARLRRPNEQLATEIRSLDEKLTEENIRALQRNLPIAEELDQVRAYDGDRLLLGTAETFGAAVAEIPLFREHIEFLRWRSMKVQ